MRARLLAPLPGIQAQADMASPARRRALSDSCPSAAIDAAVLILLTPTTPGLSAAQVLDWEVLLIRRACYPGVHSGQIALPGGRREVQDSDLWATACREAHEEVGIHTERIQAIGPLTSLYVPPSNYLIHPFLALDAGPFVYQPDMYEVQDCHTVPLRVFDPACAREHDFVTGPGQHTSAPAWCHSDYIIWGATAMILAELFRIVTSNHLEITAD